LYVSTLLIAYCRVHCVNLAVRMATIRQWTYLL